MAWPGSLSARRRRGSNQPLANFSGGSCPSFCLEGQHGAVEREDKTVCGKLILTEERDDPTPRRLLRPGVSSEAAPGFFAKYEGLRSGLCQAASRQGGQRRVGHSTGKTTL